MKKKLAAALCLMMAATTVLSGSAFAESTEASTEVEASDTDAYKNEDMSSYKIDGLSIGVSFGQNVHPFFKAMQNGICSNQIRLFMDRKKCTAVSD